MEVDMKKISQARVQRAFKKFQYDETKEPTINFDDSSTHKIYPFEVIAGFITSTANGIRKDENVKVSDYSTFTRVFTGLENIIAQ